MPYAFSLSANTARRGVISGWMRSGCCLGCRGQRASRDRENEGEGAMRTTIHRSVALFVLCLSASCAPAAHEGGSAASLASEHAGLVQVTNDGRQDFVLYMMRDGMRYRLGRVARMETARFRIPAAEDRPSYRVQLVAEPTGPGARPFVTGSILWRPGQNLNGRVAGAYTSQNFVLVTR